MDIFVRTGIVRAETGFVIPNGDAEACWEWRGSKFGAGYGQAYSPELKRNVPAHRFVWTWVHGAPPPKSSGMQLDHLCRNVSCVNPGHLELVTGVENRRRSTNRTFSEAKHGMASRYSQGCRCPECTEAMRRYREKARNLQNPFRKRYKKRGQLPLQAEPQDVRPVVVAPLPPRPVVTRHYGTGAETWRAGREKVHLEWRKWFCTCDKCAAISRGERKQLAGMYPKGR